MRWKQRGVGDGNKEVEQGGNDGMIGVRNKVWNKEVERGGVTKS